MKIAIDPSIRTKAKHLLEHLSKGLYEREQSIRLALLSAVAGESIFLLGPPGVGKSLIARRLKYAFRDGTSFEYLMSKFSTPDEIFGPVSIKKLKEEDKYVRKTDNYLPGANIVFLDEIWKAGPAIQNALLTILNEKIYRNGDQEMKVNIRGIITASNELPPKNRSLDPIWDRFLIRLEMGNIRQFSNFLDMIVDTENVYEDNIDPKLKMTKKGLIEWDQKIDAVKVPAEVLNTIQVVKVKIEEYNTRPNNASEPIRIYDRRWKKIIRLMRTSAFLNGRPQVDLMDCFLMVHCLWSQPDQLTILREIITEAIRRHGYTMAVNLQMIKKEVRDFEEDVNEEIRVKYTRTEEELMPVQEEYYELDKDDNRFEGNLIGTQQFQKLQLNEESVINIYDKELNLVNRLKAQKGSSEHTVDIYYNSVKYTYPLRTKKVERTETITKKPHSIVAKHWDERFERLTEYINIQQKRIGEESPEELKYLEENLFVDKENAEIVKANLEEVKKAMDSLRLRLEKVQFTYGSL